MVLTLPRDPDLDLFRDANVYGTVSNSLEVCPRCTNGIGRGHA
jgi:hypothetical protein